MARNNFEILVNTYNSIPYLNRTIDLSNTQEPRHSFRDGLALITEQCLNKPEEMRVLVNRLKLINNDALGESASVIDKIREEILYRANKNNGCSEATYFIYQLIDQSVRGLIAERNEDHSDYTSNMEALAFVNRVRRESDLEATPFRLLPWMVPEWYKNRFPQWNP